MRFLWVIILLFSVSAYAQTTAQQEQQIQQLLNHWRAGMGISAATLSINMPGYLPLTFNSGNANNKTLYQIGSITKSFTSAIILKLEAQGKLNIDDPITRYLPQYLPWSNITISELLNHTSGIFNYTEAGLFNQIRKTHPQAGFTPEELVRIAAQHRNYFPPGRGWKYSNTNYVLAGMIIEKVTGKPMMQVMEEYLHHGLPVYLPNTYYMSGLYPASFIARMAHGYSADGMDTTYDNMSWAYTVGGLVSNTQDLLTWWQSLFQGKVLSPEQFKQMTSLVCENPPQCSKGYGLGIVQSTYNLERIGPIWWHNGTTRGYEALVLWIPKSNIYMALTINRNLSHLLKPDLPVMRSIINILMPEPAYCHPLAKPHPKLKKPMHSHSHHNHKIIHHAH